MTWLISNTKERILWSALLCWRSVKSWAHPTGSNITHTWWQIKHVNTIDEKFPGRKNLHVTTKINISAYALLYSMLQSVLKGTSNKSTAMIAGERGGGCQWMDIVVDDGTCRKLLNLDSQKTKSYNKTQKYLRLKSIYLTIVYIFTNFI